MNNNKGQNNPMYGRKHSKETCAKMKKRWTEKRKKEQSERQTGKPASEETKRKISISNTGKKRTPEQKRKQSEWRTGRKLSEETKQKLRRTREPHVGKLISKKLKAFYSTHTHHLTGKTMPAETRRKISESKIGIPRSEETKRKIGLKSKGRKYPPRTPEQRQRNRDSWTPERKKRYREKYSGKNSPAYGRIVSDETRRKMSLANIGRKRSLESRRKYSESQKGRPAWNKGIPVTLEVRKKISESMKIARKKIIIPFNSTKPERFMQSILSVNNIKYVRNRQTITGYPDIFIEPNICVFVDGCYWHGCRKCIPEKRLLDERIQKKMQKDKDVNIELKRQNYKIVRIWEHQIKNNPLECLEIIRGEINEQAL